MSYDLMDGTTACPKCGTDLSAANSVEMTLDDSGHFEWEESGFAFVFDAPESEDYLSDPAWVPDASCVACGAEIEGTYEVFTG